MLKFMRGGRRPIDLVISANQTSLYNIFTSAGSPTDPVAVTVTINTGVVLRAALTTGGTWAAGSTITIYNNGTIAGIGGSNTAGTNGEGGWADASNLTEGQNGAAGGTAVTMTFDLAIDNTNGYVYGGGGAGGGGGSAAESNPPAAGASGPGGGGGGGRGYNNALGGTVGHDNGNITTLPTAGTAGSSSAGGAGGAGGNKTIFLFNYLGGTGGAGGTWGAAGTAGTNGSITGGGGGVTKPGGAGGAAGLAVSKGGKVLTWLGGNNSTQVKGAQT